MLRLLIFATIAFFIASGIAWSADPATQPASSLPALGHSSVSIPWEDLRPLLERNAANADRPPVDFAIASAHYDATAGATGVTVTATIELGVLVDTWVLVPVGPADSGVVGAAIDGKTAPLIVRNNGLFVLAHGAGQKKLTLTIARETAVDGGVSTFNLALVSSALVSLSVTIPQAGLSVRVPGASTLSVAQNAGNTTVTAAYHGAATATLTWRPKPPPAKVLATTFTRAAVERGALRCYAAIDYEILHSGVDSLRISLPDGVEVTSLHGEAIRDSQIVIDGQHRAMSVELKEPAEGKYHLEIEYVARFEAAKDASPAVPLLSNPSAAEEHGFVGIEVRDSVEVVPSIAGGPGMQRIDVKELPGPMWDQARSPLLFGYRHDGAGAKINLAVRRNADVDVLIAMSDICEASTTYTSEGKSITKMMFITRNNLKQFMTLKMPEGAQLWSAFVDDHPVMPAKNTKGEILIPLKKSEAESADDEDGDEDRSYRARRDRRRNESLDVSRDRMKILRSSKDRRVDTQGAAPDLKPYDVEIVFVTPAVKFADHGQLRPALPQIDIPVGHLAWAIFLPSRLRVVDAEGNAPEVSRFTLPFRHFGDEAAERALKEAAKLAQQAQQQLAQMEKASEAMIAERAKAQGVLPVRIEIPLIGDIHRFEKFLTVDEAPSVTLTYTRRTD